MKVLPSEYKSLLGYLPATIMQNIIEAKINISKELPQHYITQSVGLFSDISGFTKLSEAFSKKGRIGPEFLTFCINRYMEQIINIIGANGGDIFKFAGDAIMVIWPPDDSPNFLETTCKRAVQCAVDIQNKLNNMEIVKGKFLSVKIGLGVGECHVLFVGGIFGRCEYLCVGEAMRQACESETHASAGGQIIMSEDVQKYMVGSYNFTKAEVQPGYHAADSLMYYMLDMNNKMSSSNKISTKADAFLMRSKFNTALIKKYIEPLRSFLPAAVKPYLNIEKELWCKEIRLVTVMFLNIKVDLSQLKDKSAFLKVQEIAKTCQRCIYRTRGALNKFLMDDKGSVMLVAWGIPPFSSRTDPLQAVISCLTILQEMKKLNLKCGMGVTSGTTFSGVCGTVGGRREYSLLGEMVNLASRYMSKGLEFMKKNNQDSILMIDEKTKDLIQDKIRCRYLVTSKVKGFTIDFNFFEPISDESIFIPKNIDPFPFIRTHFSNSFTCVDSTIDTSQTPYAIFENRPKNELVNSLKIFGKKRERELFIAKLNDIYLKTTKRVLIVKGHYGVGKSLFIRRCLYDFLSQNESIGSLYINSNEKALITKPNFILCSFQSAYTANVPYNGFAFIFRQIYLWLDKNVFSREKNPEIKTDIYEFEINGDSFAELLTRTKTLQFIPIIEEMFNCNNEDLMFSKHFSQDTYEKITIIIRKPGLNRDRFFSKVIIGNNSNINIFLLELILFYRKTIDNFYSQKVPLIFIIEDTQNIDEYSINFLSDLLNKSYDAAYPFAVIMSYQLPFTSMKRMIDLMANRKEFINEMTLNEFAENNSAITVQGITLGNLVDKNEVENLIKSIVQEQIPHQVISSLFKVDPHLINILIDKSFKGIPLFIRELFESLNRLKLIQNCSDELLMTSELEDMDLMKNWIDFPIPLRIEKICGELIDSIKEKETIILKHASVIGNIFDIQMLFQIIPFNNFPINELYDLLESLEKKGIIEFLYDLHPKKKIVVCKFSFPFFREVLYQRMLIEQRSEIHMAIARLLQKNRSCFLPTEIDKKNLERHLMTGQDSLTNQMEEEPTPEEALIKKENSLNVNTLKILLVKEICGKINDMQFKLKETLEEDENNEANKGRVKLLNTIRTGFIDKKSDGKITWESRYFVVTQKVISYYYREDEFIKDKVPLASFELTDMYKIVQLKDGSFGGRRNLFSISVTKWKKKEEIKGPREYIFSTQTVKELYSWLITINFIKVKAYYDSYCLRFGIIQFPLYKRAYSQRKKNKRLFTIERIEDNQTGKMILHKSTFSGRRRSINNPNDIMTDNKRIESLKMVLERTLIIIIGNIQEHIYVDQNHNNNINCNNNNNNSNNSGYQDPNANRRNSKASNRNNMSLNLSSNDIKTPNIYKRIFHKEEDNENESHSSEGGSPKSGSLYSNSESNKNIGSAIKNYLKNKQPQLIEELEDGNSDHSSKSIEDNNKKTDTLQNSLPNLTSPKVNIDIDVNGIDIGNGNVTTINNNTHQTEIVNNLPLAQIEGTKNSVGEEKRDCSIKNGFSHLLSPIDFDSSKERKESVKDQSLSPRIGPKKEPSVFERSVLAKLKKLSVNIECDEDYYLSLSKSCLMKSNNQ